MTDSSLEVVQRLIERFGAGDVEAALELLPEDIVIVIPPTISAEPDTYEGHAGVRRYFADHSHGTHVAGTIGAAGNNGIGVTGVNWTASLMALKFITAQDTGTLEDAIEAIEFAIQAKEEFGEEANVRILSNSWGLKEDSQALRDQVEAANEADMLFVAAAGNSAENNDLLPMIPAAFDNPNVIAVAATTNYEELALLLELRLSHGAPRRARAGHPLHRSQQRL